MIFHLCKDRNQHRSPRKLQTRPDY